MRACTRMCRCLWRPAEDFQSPWPYGFQQLWAALRQRWWSHLWFSVSCWSPCCSCLYSLCWSLYCSRHGPCATPGGLCLVASLRSPVLNTESSRNRDTCISAFRNVFYSWFPPLLQWAGLPVMQWSELTSLNDYRVQGKGIQDWTLIRCRALPCSPWDEKHSLFFLVVEGLSF